MRKLKILVLLHIDLVPPELDSSEKKILKNPKTAEHFEKRDLLPWITEFDVIEGLYDLGHEVKVLGVYSDLKKIRNAIDSFSPHIVFNLLEEFDGEALFDQNVVSYLELLRVPYTGSNPRGLILCRDKSLAKKIFAFHRIPTPGFQLFPKNTKILKLKRKIKYPLIVKCLIHEASLGISSASVVHNEEKLIERVKYLHDKYNCDVIAEEFIEGNEYFVALWGNKRLQSFAARELCFDNVDRPEKEVYSSSAKWNSKYRQRKGIKTKKANISDDLALKLAKTAKRVYKCLGITGYARIDFRVSKSEDGEKIFVLEANPNPNIAKDDDFAISIKDQGTPYKKQLQKIINLGLNS